MFAVLDYQANLRARIRMDHPETSAPLCNRKTCGSSWLHPCISACGRFVDLATMAKVSVLILDEKYHGWYLHCRSPYPRVSVRAPPVHPLCG